MTATAKIRERELAGRTNRHLPIVGLLTARAMKGDQERFLAAGMDAYPSKPIRPRALENTLANFVRVPAESNADQPSPEAQPTPH